MTEYETFEDYVKNTFNIEPTELILISPEEQKKKTVAITADELINIWNELTELKLKAGRPKWHKVADGDLPKKEDLEMQVLCFTHDGYHLLSLFSDPKPIFKHYKVIAWCEIPPEE